MNAVQHKSYSIVSKSFPCLLSHILGSCPVYCMTSMNYLFWSLFITKDIFKTIIVCIFRYENDIVGVAEYIYYPISHFITFLIPHYFYSQHKSYFLAQNYFHACWVTSQDHALYIVWRRWIIYFDHYLSLKISLKL